MALTPFTIERFGGLNLDPDPQEIGPAGAVDLTNVDFDQAGRVRCRDGYTQAKALTMTTPRGLAAYETTSGSRHFIVGYENGGTKTYAAYNSTGGAAVATATPASALVKAVRFGTSSNQYLYIANGTDTIWRWSGAAFTQPAGMPASVFLALMPTSNRLVAGFTGGGNSRLEFSGAGTPETWGASDFVDLTPGDESALTGLATWQNYLFAFKSRRFFVFTGESIDADGGAIFNYRTVDGYGSTVPAVAGDEGVYFFDGSSVWVTQGGPPRDVSHPIRRFLNGEVTVGGSAFGTTTSTAVRLSYAVGRLYLSFDGLFGLKRALVYDPKTDTWTYYDANFYFGVALHPQGDDNVRVYWLDSSGVNSFSNTSHSDNGSSISWNWKSGAYSIADPGRNAVTLESSMIGAGTVTLQVSNDYGTFDTGSAVTLGTISTPAEGWQQIDREGRRWQHRFSGSVSSNGAFVSSLTHYVSSVKPAGVY